MSSWARLEIGDAITFLARYHVPIMWTAGFEGALATSAGEWRARLAALAPHVASTDYVCDLWEGLPVVLEVVAAAPPDARVVLDAEEVAAMSDEGVEEAALEARMTGFARLRAQWDASLAKRLAVDARSDVLTGDLERDRRRARRVTEEASERGAFFSLSFGRIEHVAAIDAWIAAAPACAPLASPEEDAERLARALVDAGLIVLPEEAHGMTMRLLETAARFRTPEALQEVIDVLFGMRLVEAGTTKPRVWRELDRVVGPDPAEAPLYERAVLSRIVDAIGD